MSAWRAVVMSLGMLMALLPVSGSQGQRTPPDRRVTPYFGAFGGGIPTPSVTAVSITTGSIRLSLQLGATAYPRNALVLATIRLTNHSGHSISTWDCLRSSLGVEVPRSGGVGTLYPPLLPPPGAPWYGCPGDVGMGGMRRQMTTIPAGQTLTRMTYVVLRAFTIRAWAQLTVRAGQMKPTLIQTPQVRLREIAAPGPAVYVRVGSSVSARVIPVPRAGPILYSEYASCGATAPNEYFNASATYSRWSRMSGTLLYPFNRTCRSLSEWVVFVAQPSRPIAQAYYCARHDRCAYAPPTPQEQGITACKLDVARTIMTGRLPRSAARYAIGLSSIPPVGLTPTRQVLAQKIHARCAPLLTRRGHTL
ncbi:MAG: hypothetical protein NVS2B16_36940 [Chloroflexota bacterium]